MLVTTLFSTPAMADEQLVNDNNTENTKNQHKDSLIKKLMNKFSNKEQKENAEKLVKEAEDIMYNASAHELLEKYSRASIEVDELKDKETRDSLSGRLDNVYDYYKKLNRAELKVKEAVDKCKQAPISIQSARDNIFSNLDTESKYTNKLLSRLEDTEKEMTKKEELEEDINENNPYIFIDTTTNDSITLNSDDNLEIYWDNLYQDYDEDLEDAEDIGWKKENEKWYYLDSTGERCTGWIWYNNHKYFLDGTGELKIGWFKQDGEWYYAHPNGDIAMNETINGYQLGKEGKILRN